MDLQALGVDVATDSGDVADEVESNDPSTSEETADDTTAASSDTGEPDADGTEVTPVDKDKPADGRSIPAKYRELFKADKELRALYFHANEFKKHFENPAKAAETLEQLSALGCFEGIAATSAEFADIDKMFATGDKTLLDKFLAADDNKAGFAKLGPALLDEFRKVDEAGWTHSIAQVMASTLTQAGVGNDIAQLSTLLKDNPEALALVKKIGSLVGGIDKLAEAPPKPQVDPDREKLNKDRADFEKSKSELFMNEVNSVVGVHIEKGIKDSLTPYIKNRKLDAESYSLIEANVGGELTKLMNADPQFTAQKDAVMKSGDKARIQTFFTARITKHLPDAAKKVMRAFGSANGIPPAVKTNGAPPVPAGVVRLSAPPKPDDIDYKRSRDIIMDSKAYLKNGKLVTW